MTRRIPARRGATGSTASSAIPAGRGSCRRTFRRRSASTRCRWCRPAGRWRRAHADAAPPRAAGADRQLGRPPRSARAHARAAHRAVARHDADPAAPLRRCRRWRLGGGRRFQRGGIALASSVGDSGRVRGPARLPAGRPAQAHPLAKLGAHRSPGGARVSGRSSSCATRSCSTRSCRRRRRRSRRRCRWRPPSPARSAPRSRCWTCSSSVVEAHCVTAGRGVGHVERLLEILAAVRPCRDRLLRHAVATRARAPAPGVGGRLRAGGLGRRRAARLVERLRAAGVPTRGRAGDRRTPSADTPADVHRVTVGRVAEDSAAALMRPPLLGVALVFWGWETGLLPVGIVMALALEAAHVHAVALGSGPAATSIGCPT